jgi:hypothetical protein
VNAKHPEVYGLYDVETLRIEARELGDASDPQQWRKAWFTDQGFGIRSMDDRVIGYAGKFDKAPRSFTTNDGKGKFIWSTADEGRVILEGTLGGQSVSARLRRIDTSKLMLNDRGFHWISEFPFNR